MGCLFRWNFNDQAIVIHRSKYPSCSFIQDQSTSGNIPLLTGRTARSRSSISPSISSPSGGGTVAVDSPYSRWTTGARPSSLVFRSERHFRLFRSMTKEDDRLATFRRWPKADVVQPFQLARAGFFYTGKGDTVQCAFCCGRLQEWQSGDDPVREHREHFPDCPLTGRGGAREQPESGSQERSTVEVVMTTPSPPSCSQTETGRKESSGQLQMKEMGIVSHTPVHSYMSTYQARLQSYRGWPPDRKQRPQDLASAGFFFAG